MNINFHKKYLIDDTGNRLEFLTLHNSNNLLVKERIIFPYITSVEILAGNQVWATTAANNEMIFFSMDIL